MQAPLLVFLPVTVTMSLWTFQSSTVILIYARLENLIVEQQNDAEGS
jgi:hypothetical protein